MVLPLDVPFRLSDRVALHVFTVVVLVGRPPASPGGPILVHYHAHVDGVPVELGESCPVSLSD